MALTLVAYSGATLGVTSDNQDAGGLPLQEIVRVQSRLLQVKLGVTTLLSASQGAEFLLEQDGEFFRLHAGNGNIAIADLKNQKVWPVTPGVWVIKTSSQEVAPQAPIQDYTGNTHDRQNFMFADYVLLRQQSYIDRFQVPLSTANRFLSNVLGTFIRTQ